VLHENPGGVYVECGTRPAFAGLFMGKKIPPEAGRTNQIPLTIKPYPIAANMMNKY
jgi:hypothetical protein